MHADLYVREKLREMGEEASRAPMVSVEDSGVPFVATAARLLGRALCRIGERLQWAGTSFERDAQKTSLRERGLLRRTD